jgi:hypothetical protein
MVAIISSGGGVGQLPSPGRDVIIEVQVVLASNQSRR